MADVFISYERTAEATARRVAAALTRAGHNPWFDALLPAHRDYSDVIEERLKATDVVLVLWSQAAHQSQWVRAEADYARQEKKLVQAVLDDRLPPMPFNRIQCARLAGWIGGAKSPEWRKVLDGIDQISSIGAHALEAAPSLTPIAPPRTRRNRTLALALGSAVLLASGLWLGRDVLTLRAAPIASRIAVLPFDALSTNPDARFFADGLTDQILTALNDSHIEVVSRDDAATLRGADRDKRLIELNVRLLLDGTVGNDGKTLSVSVHLNDPAKHAALWSAGLSGPVDKGAQLQGQMATTIVSLLECANTALTPAHGLKDPALLTSFLHACDLYWNSNGATDPKDMFDALAAYRNVTAHAPDFAGGHADLAQFEAHMAPLLPADQAAVLRAQATAEAKQALVLDPKSSNAFLAQEELLPPDHWADRELLLRKALAANPDWPNTNGFLGITLAEAGRLSDALSFTRKVGAVSGWGWAPINDIIEAAAGHPERCTGPMLDTVKLAPNDSGNWHILNQCLQYAGRWDDARAMFDSANSRPVMDPASVAATLAFIAAAKSRAPAETAKALALNLAVADAGDSQRTAAIAHLSMLGDLEDAFAVASRYNHGSLMTGANSEFLFFPFTAPMRRDPRFMKLAARLGLVHYWLTSGHWPDFCSEPGLPYDCKLEAAKLTAKPV